MPKEPRFTDGKRGAALPVRVIPRASKNEIVGILNDQTVKVKLTSLPADAATNQALISFLAEVLGVAASKIEIVAGEQGRDKLVSVLDVTSEELHQKILAMI